MSEPKPDSTSGLRTSSGSILRDSNAVKEPSQPKYCQSCCPRMMSVLIRTFRSQSSASSSLILPDLKYLNDEGTSSVHTRSQLYLRYTRAMLVPFWLDVRDQQEGVAKRTAANTPKSAMHDTRRPSSLRCLIVLHRKKTDIGQELFGKL